MKRIIEIFLLIGVITCLENGLGLTPPMGWNSWNKFGCNINEKLIYDTIDTIVSSGLAKAGYTYVNLDDCWHTTRDSDGIIVPNPDKFPNGIKPLAEYAHKKGLKFGIYSDAGFKTCCGFPGSLDNEEIDANTFADWGIDYIKYDNCNADGRKPEERYTIMRDALNSTGRPIYFSMCEWGIDDPAKWGKKVANSWRTSGDIEDNWASMLKMIDNNDRWADYAGPGGWNDPDMLEVGNGGMTTEEYKAHFGLWALAKAPLLIGCDLTTMTEDTLNILTNEEVIAINQDPLGVQGKKLVSKNDAEIWGGPLDKDGFAIILLNRGTGEKEITATFKDLQIPYDEANIRDLWAKKDLGKFKGSYSATVKSHTSVFLRLTKIKKEE